MRRLHGIDPLFLSEGYRFSLQQIARVIASVDNDVGSRSIVVLHLQQ
jgi:hypothetical protein